MRVPPELHDPILARVAKGQSLQVVADWLATKGISVSKQAVGKIVQKHRTERAETTKHVVREHIEATLPADLSELAGLRKTNRALLRKAQRVATKKTTVANAQMVKMLSDAVERAAEAEAKALGLHEPDKLASTLFDLLGQVLASPTE